MEKGKIISRVSRPSVSPEAIKQAAEDLTKTSPLCPRCGGFLQQREFVDCWNAKTGEPTDVNEDLYCQPCDLRWCAESGPHSFKEDWNPQFHKQRA